MIATTISDLDKSLDRAPERRAVWQALISQTPANQRKSVEYIVTYMPVGDLKGLDPKVVADHVTLAFETRTRADFGKAIPESIFNDSVVPYCSVTETRQSKRQEFHERYFKLVKGLKSPGAAALAINARLFADYKVTYNTKRLRTDQSSPETISQGMATCTGLSIMLVDALRSVGVPARLAGINTWPGSGGNHTWVEVWDKGWHYVGAAEPDQHGLDHAWFTDQVKTAIKGKPENAVFAVTFRDTGEHFPLAWDPGGSTNAENVTDRYAPQAVAAKREVRFEVRHGGTRVKADVVVWDLSTGKEVIKALTLGPSDDVNRYLTVPITTGDYFIKAWFKGKTKYAFANGDSTAPVVIDINEPTDLSPLFAARFGTDEKLAAVATKLLGTIPYSATIAASAWEQYRASDRHQALKEDFALNTVITPDRTSPFQWRFVGSKPKDGWALVIAMHGGGGVPKAVNDQQWDSMFKSYYKDHPEAGGYIYCALRAPNDEWNGFYDDSISQLVERLIQAFAVTQPMDLNRVSITGASHGGYGAFVIGPKIPYRFAAINASASAPSPGETAGENLRNVQFSWIVGEQDTDYGRADRCKEFEAAVAGWKQKYGGYPGGLRFLPGVGHNVPDRDLTAEFMTRTRDPWPKKLVWTQTDDRLHDFYWLTAEKLVEGGHIEAEVKDNTIFVKSNSTGKITIWLSEKLVDLTKPITVIRTNQIEGQLSGPNPAIKKFQVKPSLADYADSLLQWSDPNLAGVVRIDI